MLRNRLITCLLLEGGDLYNSKRFSKDKYVGDPINAVKIFNEKFCDELMICDIGATKNQTPPNFALLREIAEEAKMPICYAGGIKSKTDVAKLINLGIEKVAISSSAMYDETLLPACVAHVGAQSVCAVIDYKSKRGVFGRNLIVTSHCNSNEHRVHPMELAKRYENCGVGEIIFNSIDHDGQKCGYDIDFLAAARQNLNLPISAIGGAKDLDDVALLTAKVGLIGCAASTMFVYKGRHDAILLQYPDVASKNSATRIE